MDDRERVDRLETVLASVGAHLLVDGSADAGMAGPQAHVAPPWRRPLIIAAIVVAVVAASVLSIAPARRTVSGWLHAGPIDVEVDPELTVERALPAFVDGSTPLNEDELTGALGRPLPDITRSVLGPPHGWWAPPERGVLATWNEAETSLWIVAAEDTFAERLEKWILEPELSQDLPTLGDGGYVVAGEHVLDTPYRRVRAQNVVAWTDGGLTFRLDSSMAGDELIEVAEAIEAAMR